MRIPMSVRRRLRARAPANLLAGALLLLLALCGGLMLVDRIGLCGDYYALGAPWEGRPYGTGVGPPGLEDPSQVGEYLAIPAVFSVRWHGWWEVKQTGEHRFYIDADDGGYLRIDGQAIAEASSAEGRRAASGRIELERGFHEIEVGYFQREGNGWLGVHWVAPGGDERSAALLPTEDLYAGRPLFLRKILRSLGAAQPRPYRQLGGALLVVGALGLLAGFMRRALREVPALGPRWAALGRGPVRLALLGALFLCTFFAVFPYTGTVVGGDDTSYLETSTFDVQTWYVNRYAHVYLLKLFTALVGGDPLLGVRAWWSFTLAATVSALAVAVRSVGPGLQLRTLAVTLLVLFAQPTIWGLVGAGFADFSAMMFVTVGTATALHGFGRARDRPRHEWHALAIGALTVGAARSKEVGAILLILPLLFGIAPGTLFDGRRWARRMLYWALGAAAVLLALALLDGWILGDFAFTWNEARQASMKRINFPSDVKPRDTSWLDNLWGGREMRLLWTGVAAAAMVAGARRCVLHVRLAHLMPIAYLVAIIALYVRLPHPFSNRMLIPILPLACLANGLLLHHLGLDDVPWRRFARAPLLTACGAIAALVGLFVIPLQNGSLDAAALLPVERLGAFGWEPALFVTGVLLPMAVLGALAGASFVVGRREPRLAVLLLGYLVLFGPGFERSRASLAKRWAAQTGDLLLYPWRVFRDELDSLPEVRATLSTDLRGYYRMTATTNHSLARLALRRPDVHVTVARAPALDAPIAIGSYPSYLAWVREQPALAETARFAPDGLLVLVRPREASRRRPETSSKAPSGMSVAELLQELKTSRSVEARREFVDWAVAREWSSLDRGAEGLVLQGRQLSAFGLHADGWTDGLSAAGLLVDNRSPLPLAQRLSLTPGAVAAGAPVRVQVDDGESVSTVLFEHVETREVALSPVPPFSVRLFVLWSESSWIPGGGDQRELGVLIRAPERP